MPHSETSSLKAYDSVGDRIRQHRQADRRGVLVVEGPSDKRLIDRLTGARWAIFPAGSRDRVAPAVGRAHEIGVSRVAGLIDRDFDNYLDDVDVDSIFSWIEADLEAVLVRGPWFERLLQELGSDDKIDSEGGPETLRPIAIGIAGVVGLVRRGNVEHNWKINFKDLDWIKKVDAGTLQLSLAKFAAAIEGKVDGREHKAVVRALLADVDPTYDWGPGSFRGKDALEVMKLALKRRYGNTASTDADVLAGALRLHVDESVLNVEPFPDIVSCLGDD
jgi:hypothetical protein